MPRMPQSLLSRVKSHLPALTRRRKPEPLPLVLHRKRIYIVPSGFGFGFAVLLIVMLTGALNYANNAALLLTCLLGAATAASMLVTFRTLDGLRVGAIETGHAVVGEPLEIALHFTPDRLRPAIRLDLQRRSTAFALDDALASRITITLPTETRGWQPLPRMRLWSSWPLGLFRAWSWVHPDQSVLVWPKAEIAGPPPSGTAEEDRHLRKAPGDELASLRDYRVGDPQRHIAWKASARHPTLLVKEFEQPLNLPHWELDWRDTAGLDHELRISRLARWINEARAGHRHYSLTLPTESIASGSGHPHYVQCMNALAQLP